MAKGQEIPLIAGHPLLGSLPEVRADRFAYQLRVGREYGDLVRGRFGLFQALIINSPEMAGEVLVEHADDFVKSYDLSIFARPLLGDGLITSEHELHKRQRRLIAPVFAPRRVASHGEVIVERAEAAAERMLAKGEVDVCDEAMRVTLEIIAKTLFDAELGSEASVVVQALTEARDLSMRSLTGTVPVPPFIPTPTNLRLRRAIARLDRVVYGLIAERRKHPFAHNDLLSLLLAARDHQGGGGMDDRQVRDEAMTAFIAGYDTTASALAWAMWLIARHPEARARAQSEIDSALGQEPLCVKSLEKLPATLRLFKEAMRLYPPACSLGRVALRDVRLSGGLVRKKQLVVINTLAIHHRPDLFPEPERFDPDRFSKEREQGLPRYAFMPFGGGHRTCIGSHFALLEGQLILTSWLRRLDTTLSNPERAVETELFMTLRPKGPIPMRVRARH